MKKNIIIAALAAATALFVSASCTKQDTDLQAVSGAKVFTASIEQVQTKTSLGTYEGHERPVNVIFWDKRDSILINKETFYSAEPDSENPMSAEFLHCGGPEPKAPYEAIFPASLYDRHLKAYCFPRVQEYRAGKFNAPMYAYDENKHLLFKNICGVICFSLKGTEKIQSIELTSQAKDINGVFKVVESVKEDYTAEIDLDAEGYKYDANTKTVTLYCGKDGVQLSKTDSTNFFIYLPETHFAAEDLSVRVTTADGKSFEKTASNPVTVEKNTVYTFNWEVDATVQHTLATFFRGLSEDQARLAAATDEAMSEALIEQYKNNPQKLFLPEIHTWSNARPAILAIEESLAKIDNNVVNLIGLTKPELRFLEGYLYFELAKTYGKAPILSLDNPNPETTSLDGLIDFIVKNAEEARNELQKKYDQDKKTIELAEGIEMIRPTKIAALALRARTFLYFASPLFNQNSDPSRWSKAAAFFKEGIDCGAGSLASQYGSSWDFDSPELIFGVKFTQANNVYAGIHPTQSMVDQYLGNDGNLYVLTEPIDFATAFTKIDSRFGSTIALPTSTDGYTLKKSMSTFLPIFRYADILLGYAEVRLNMGSCTQEDIDKSVNLLRKRAGIKNLELPNVSSQNIESERLAELAFEGHRFWDVRRWKKGGPYFGSSINILQVSDGGGKLVGSRKNIALPYWNESYNFYPTPW